MNDDCVPQSKLTHESEVALSHIVKPSVGSAYDYLLDHTNFPVLLLYIAEDVQIIPMKFLYSIHKQREQPTCPREKGAASYSS